MTRRQAEAVAKKIVAAARKEASTLPNGAIWEAMDVNVGLDLYNKIGSSPMLVSQCLPIGWTMEGGSEVGHIVLRRRL